MVLFAVLAALPVAFSLLLISLFTQYISKGLLSFNDATFTLNENIKKCPEQYNIEQVASGSQSLKLTH
jgi:hypothetical protein